MDLRELISGIGHTYDRTADMRSRAQQLIKGAPHVLARYLPPGYLPDASGGKGQAAAVPWIAIFDPRETTTAQRGVYLVYLFAADLSSVFLSLNQGMTELRQKFKRQARSLLTARAHAMRQCLGEHPDLDSAIDLRFSGTSHAPRLYEAGNVLARRYEVNALPSTTEMAKDLHRFLELYEYALTNRDDVETTPDTSESPLQLTWTPGRNTQAPAITGG